MKSIKNIACLMACGAMVALASCGKQPDEITKAEFGRLFSPTTITATVENETDVVVEWSAVRGAASYTIEVFDNPEPAEGAAPQLTVGDIAGSPYTISDLQEGVEYLIRIKAVGANTGDSKWAAVVAETGVIPTSVGGSVENFTEVVLTWTAVRGATSYTVEVFDNGNLAFDGVPVLTVTDIADSPYTITGLEEDTDYSIRIKPIGANVSESKWMTYSIKTGIDLSNVGDYLLDPATDGVIEATSVTLRWTADVTTADRIVLTPSTPDHAITSSELAAREATISGLTALTAYTATLYNGQKILGRVTFTTPMDFSGMETIEAGDDIVQKLNDAADGTSFLVKSGTFELGEYAPTKSVTLVGYSITDKPIIKGAFKISTANVSLTLKSLVVDGQKADLSLYGNLVTANDAVAIPVIHISDCELMNFNAGLLNNNKVALIGDVTISNCIITNVVGSGGDCFDLRSGSCSSLTVEKSTFNGGSAGGIRTLLRIYPPIAGANVVFSQCTFYNICTADFFRIADNTNTTLFKVEKCLFLSARNVWCTSSSNMKATTNYIANIYDAASTANLWKESGALYKQPPVGVTLGDPQIENAAAGNFKVKNPAVTAGDPRWLR